MRRSKLAVFAIIAPALMLYGAAMASLAQAADVERTYRESRASLLNPERGFYVQRSIERLGRLDEVRERGMTLVLLTVNLRDFKERDLTPEKRDELRKAMTAARQAGLKVIFRAAYGFSNRDYRTDPKDMGRILGHIKQLGSVLTDERDVLYCVQAGFLGPWGEWHGSNWGDPPSLEARRGVLFGLLDALPAPIPVQIRRPMFIRDLFAAEPGGYELTEATAFGGSKRSRTGWHNDALLAMPNDMGTYAERGWDRNRELEWLSRNGRYAPFGGESVGPASRTPADQAIRELEMLHASYLNSGYHPQVLRAWRQTEYRGENAFDHISRRLGHRLTALKLKHAPLADLKPGDVFRCELTLTNSGFASPQLPRIVEFALKSQGEAEKTAEPFARALVKDADPRRWGPEAGAIVVRGEISIPKDAPAGRRALVVRFADPSETLRNDGRYAIRLANEDIPFSQRDGWCVLLQE